MYVLTLKINAKGSDEKMIYTITFNPAIDYVITVDDFKAGLINRVASEEKFAGGKGINVSRVLNKDRKSVV